MGAVGTKGGLSSASHAHGSLKLILLPSLQFASFPSPYGKFIFFLKMILGSNLIAILLLKSPLGPRSYQLGASDQPYSPIHSTRALFENTDIINFFRSIFPILLIGDAGVGKSSLLFRFCDNTFIESFSTLRLDFVRSPSFICFNPLLSCR
jgi:hypothetical protein